MSSAQEHLDDLGRALLGLRADADRLCEWGESLADTLLAGGRLLAVGNGGSAAHAHHLVSELVGRYRRERPPLAAIALSADPSIVTAIGNDYGIEEIFARQVAAHGRPGDVLVAFSTSGRSPNVLAAVRVADRVGLRTWAFSGARPNPLAAACDDALTVAAPHTATVQEVHQVAIHLLCEAVDDRVLAASASPMVTS